ncbi:TPA: ABC transporter ATP-binding protein [Clostridioides difficile]|uniref:ABC transporter ATP-binding protein n=1 Tax=Clostridioides difficile TaxID=1496 RepID=UPI0003B28B3A|nr:energy-coupling factor ABC transporter ATP-binding protein [Clostridioides difficile]MCI4242023.1 energy-coupling factor ABC transporter ATP-binding protein [Clostridioides difficile]MDB9599632.1 energy-coupling factor ABC transporter ATP-binding protein [Clostridioides difficile]MDN9363186.1 energy-coupling factor ABC transporter ATP-binding protein [Clostridioides difficile]MDN9409032.1 energy-coupling factor ABC transporter ATP-binding protein [Clostridioides difficile]MDN9511363.1 energ
MIEFKNISFSYCGQKQGSLKEINLHIKKGECVLLCGRSGCGKTTIIRLINGVIPHFYTGDLVGDILIEGEHISEFPMYKIAEYVGSVFQNPRTQFFNIDTDSEIAFGLENMAYDSERIANIVEKVAIDLDIEKLRGRSIFKLSGGEKQKIAFASVYAMNPDIFLLDEPSSNLDMISIKNLRKKLKKLKDKGKTILIAEHRIFYLMDLVDKIIYLEEGKIAKVYCPKEFRKIPLEQRKAMGLRSINLSEENFKYRNLLNGKKDLKINNLTVFYKKRDIIKNCSFQVDKGEIIALTGNNGEGKTTFSRVLCGLHKEYIGDIFWGNKQIKEKERLEISYMVMQDVNYQLFAESVQEECLLGIKNPDKNKVNEILKRLDLYNFKNLHPNRLSGGQKQRVAVAVSMICNKEILIFDEPTSGLDYESMIKVSKLLKELASMGKIIFVITHDYELICQVCTRILHLSGGRFKYDLNLDEENFKIIEKIFTNK